MPLLGQDIPILTKPDFYDLLQMQQMLPPAVAVARALRQMTTLRHGPFNPLSSTRLTVHTPVLLAESGSPRALLLFQLLSPLQASTF